MPEQIRRIYWDSCVFLSFLEQTPRRMPTLDAIVASARAGRDIQIFTSTLSIAEVAFAAAERTGNALDASVEASTDDLWNDPTINLVEISRFVAYDARTLVREAMIRNVTHVGPTLKSADAIHLATAQRIAVSEFQTDDDTILKQGGLVGFPIRERFSPQPRLVP